jgi:hypothetical protein
MRDFSLAVAAGVITAAILLVVAFWQWQVI